VGSHAYEYASQLSYQPDDCLLEVGSGPASSAYLAELASQTKVAFVSVDVDPVVSEYAARHASATAVTARAEDVLRDWHAPPWVRFAWLDGYDWPYEFFAGTAGQRAAYASRGEQITQAASAASHLAIVQCLHPLTRPNAVVALDDTWLLDEPGAVADGKGKTAVPYLTSLGWRVLDNRSVPGRSDNYVVLNRVA
jgi:hypothetical protein